LDEAAAVVLLLNCLAYFGIDLRGFFERKSPVAERPDSLPQGKEGER
jgi:hypothetical protein